MDDFGYENETVEFGEFINSDYISKDLPQIGGEDGVFWMDHEEEDENSDDREFKEMISNFKDFTLHPKNIPKKIPFWNLNKYMVQRMAFNRATTGPNTQIHFALQNVSVFEPQLDLIPSLLPQYDIHEPHLFLIGKILIPNPPNINMSSKLIKVDGHLIPTYHDQIVLIRVPPAPLNWKPQDSELLTSLIKECQRNAQEFNDFEKNFNDTMVFKDINNQSITVPTPLLPPDGSDFTCFHSLHPFVDASSRGFLTDDYLETLLGYINDTILWRTKNEHTDLRKAKLAHSQPILGFSRIPPNFIEFPSIDGFRMRKKSMPRSMLGFMPDENYDPNFYRLWIKSKEYIPYILRIIESPKYMDNFDFLRIYSDEDYDCQWRMNFGINFNENYLTTNYSKMPDNIVSTFFRNVGTIPSTTFYENNLNPGVLFLDVSFDSFMPYVIPTNEKKEPQMIIKPHSNDMLSFDLECLNHFHPVTKKRMFPIAYLTPQILQEQVAKKYLPDAAQKRITAKYSELKCPDFCSCLPCRKMSIHEREHFKMDYMKNLIGEEIEQDERINNKYGSEVAKSKKWLLDQKLDADRVMTICFTVTNIDSTKFSDPCEATYYYILYLMPDKLNGPLINENLILGSKKYRNTRCVVYNTEIDLILGFLDHVKQICPGKLSGYNIVSFDFSYLQDRFKWYAKYGSPEEKQIVENNPFSIGLIRGYSRYYSTKTVFRPNLGLRTIKTIYPFIFTILDVYEGVNNETFSTPSKIRSFKLNSIAAKSLFYPGTTDPMLKLAVDPAKGEEYWNNDTNSRTLFFLYCLIDSVLALGLCRAYGFSKLMDIIASTCGILPTLVFSTGVIEKILNLYRIFNVRGNFRDIMPALRGKMMMLAHHPNVWLYSPSRSCDENLDKFPYAQYLQCPKTNLIIPHILEVAARRWGDNIMKGEEKPFLPTINYDREFFVSNVSKKNTHTTKTVPSKIMEHLRTILPITEDSDLIQPAKEISATKTKDEFIGLSWKNCPQDPGMIEIQTELETRFSLMTIPIGAEFYFKTINQVLDYLKSMKVRLLKIADAYMAQYGSSSPFDKQARYYFNFRLKTMLRMISKLEKIYHEKKTYEQAQKSISGLIVSTPFGINNPNNSSKPIQLDLITGKQIESATNFQKSNSSSQSSNTKPKKQAKTKGKKPFVGGYNKNMTRCFKNTFTVFNDFNSLYPSIEKALFLCFENLFTGYMNAMVYPETSPLLYRTRVIGTWDDTICGEFMYDPDTASREYYTTPFLSYTNWIQDPDCLTNQIVDTLLDLRGVAKNHMNFHTTQACQAKFHKLLYDYDGKSHKSLIERLLDKDKYAEDNGDFGTKPNFKLDFLKQFGIKEIKPEMISLMENNPKANEIFDAQNSVKKTLLETEVDKNFHTNQKNNFNTQQNGMKILNNSGFGFFGSQRGIRELASCICSYGRFEIQMSATISKNTCMLQTMVRRCHLGPYLLSIGIHPGAWYPNQYNPSSVPLKKDWKELTYNEHYFCEDRVKWPPITEEHYQKKSNCSTFKEDDGGDTDSSFNSTDSKFISPSGLGTFVKATLLSNSNMIIKKTNGDTLVDYNESIPYYDIIKIPSFYEAEVIIQRALPFEFTTKYENIPPILSIFNNSDEQILKLFLDLGIDFDINKTQPFWFQIIKHPSQILKNHFISKETARDNLFVDIVKFLWFSKECGYIRILSQKIVVEKISDYFVGYGKKRYGFNNLEVKKLVLKGLSLVRGDALPITSKLLDACFKKIFFSKASELEEIEKKNKTKYSRLRDYNYIWNFDLSNPNVLSIVQMFEFLIEELEKISEDKNLNISDFVLSQRLKKDPSMYESELPHVTVASKMLQRGDSSVTVGSTISYVYFLDPVNISDKKLQTLLTPSKTQLKSKVILKTPKKKEPKTSQNLPSASSFFTPKKTLKNNSELTIEPKMGKMTGSLLSDMYSKPEEVVLSHVFKRDNSVRMSVDTPEYVIKNGYSLDLQYYVLEKIIPTLAIALAPFVSDNSVYPQVLSSMSKEEVKLTEDKQKQFVETQKRFVSSLLITEKLKSNLKNGIDYNNCSQLKNKHLQNLVETEKCILCMGFFVKKNFFIEKKQHINIEYPICPDCKKDPKKVITVKQEKESEKIRILKKYQTCAVKCENCIIRSEIGLNPEELNIPNETFREMNVTEIWKRVTKTNNMSDIEDMIGLNNCDYSDEPKLQNLYPRNKWISNFFDCTFEECGNYQQRNILHLSYQKITQTIKILDKVSTS